jgi:hypothetical protein
MERIQLNNGKSVPVNTLHETLKKLSSFIKENEENNFVVILEFVKKCKDSSYPILKSAAKAAQQYSLMEANGSINDDIKNIAPQVVIYHPGDTFVRLYDPTARFFPETGSLCTEPAPCSPRGGRFTIS